MCCKFVREIGIGTLLPSKQRQHRTKFGHEVVTLPSESRGTEPSHRGTSLIRKRTPLGPYGRPMPRVLGGWAFSYERGTPVLHRVATQMPPPPQDHHVAPGLGPLGSSGGGGLMSEVPL